eukprot:Hpha_TRINITY_DN7333_c0_g1::TRINITY_DN7333_c0_g1_i1::g.9975::m.9975
MALACSALLQLYSIGAIPFVDTFPWQRVPTMAQSAIPGKFSRTSMNGTGRFDDKIVKFYADNYDIISLANLEPGVSGCLEPKIKEFADRVNAFNPDTIVLVYMASQLHHGNVMPPGATKEPDQLCGL